MLVSLVYLSGNQRPTELSDFKEVNNSFKSSLKSILFLNGEK